MNQWQKKAENILEGIEKWFDLPMSEITTFKIGGPLDLLVEPGSIEELHRVLSFCAEEKIPWMVVGLGSNLLVRDKGIRGVGIKLAGKFTHWEVLENEIIAGAGLALSDLAKKTACLGLSGLEFACGIPGTVGGAVFMNAGAYGGEMAQVILQVKAFSLPKGSVVYDQKELKLSYRFSRFQEETEVITEVRLVLHPAENENISARISDLTCQRETKQPLAMPSAGSVFRRPTGYYVGPLIEESGLKGFSIGGAQVSPKHAGFIVNTGKATAQDVLDLIAHIKKVIKEKKGVELIPEIRVIGED